MAPQAPVRSAAIQRWYQLAKDQSAFVENGKFPQGSVPLDGLWVMFKPEYQTDVSVRGRYNPHLAKPNRFDLTQVAGDVNGTNDSREKTLGCSVFVAADFRKEKLTDFVKSCRGNETLMPLVMGLMRQSSTTQSVKALYKELKIVETEEQFEDLSAMVRELGKSPDVKWSGAIAWEGHIVRAAGTGMNFTAWDPQGGLANYLLPSRQRLDLITFSSERVELSAAK